MTDPSSRPNNYAELRLHEKLLLAVLAGIMRLWSKSLRFHWDEAVQAIIDKPPGAALIILWHNRLFAAPEFFRRQFSQRQIGTLISASRDGAWLAAFVIQLGMFPIRGSRYQRGAQSVREMIAAHRAGMDIAITPDGSRGPCYDMKPGAVTVALKTGAPLVLLSLNFSKFWRLKSWDRFYLPFPFSRVEVQMELIDSPQDLSEDPVAAVGLLKERMDAITLDP